MISPVCVDSIARMLAFLPILLFDIFSTLFVHFSLDGSIILAPPDLPQSTNSTIYVPSTLLQLNDQITS